MWILVIEDDTRLASLLQRGLEAEGHQVDTAADGKEGETLARVNAYDLLIVDWRLPYQDGKTVIENLRADGFSFPVLMLTALDDIDHRVAGLDAGADDYLAKPFSFEELLARIRALHRRPPIAAHDQVLRLEGLTLHTERRQATLHGRELLLRPKEFALLTLFMHHPEAVLSRTIIAERVWGSALYVSDNVIDVTISGLRHKLQEAQPAPPAIELETIRGVGYRLHTPSTPDAASGG